MTFQNTMWLSLANNGRKSFSLLQQHVIFVPGWSTFFSFSLEPSNSEEFLQRLKSLTRSLNSFWSKYSLCEVVWKSLSLPTPPLLLAISDMQNSSFESCGSLRSGGTVSYKTWVWNKSPGWRQIKIRPHVTITSIDSYDINNTRITVIELVFGSLQTIGNSNFRQFLFPEIDCSTCFVQGLHTIWGAHGLIWSPSFTPK